jgi:RHS repeat-associated protein
VAVADTRYWLKINPSAAPNKYIFPKFEAISPAPYEVLFYMFTQHPPRLHPRRLHHHQSPGNPLLPLRYEDQPPSNQPVNLGTERNNAYLYNGKEFNDDFGLNWYDYGARFYDPQIARFHSIDPLAENFTFQSPYVYAANNPIRFIDYMGMSAEDPDEEEKRRQEEQAAQEAARQAEQDAMASRMQELLANAKVWDSSNFDESLQSDTYRVLRQGQSKGNGFGNTLGYFGAGIGAFGFASDGVGLFTSSNLPNSISYTRISGTSASLSSSKVIGLANSAGNLALGAGIVIDVSLSLTGNQTWGKTILNTGIGLTPLIIGSGPGLVLGLSYFALDGIGAFDKPAFIPHFTPSFSVPDATYVKKPLRAN